MRKRLENDITEIVKDINSVTELIGNCYIVISGIEDKELQKVYAKESIVFIDDYKKLSQELQSKLELYFKIEEDEKTVINFQYRQLYSKLMKLI